MQKLTKNVSGYMAIVTIITLYVVNTLVYKLIPSGDTHDWAYYLVSGTLTIIVAVALPTVFGYDFKNRVGIKVKPDFITSLLVVLAGCLLMVFGLGYSNILYYLLEMIGYTSPSLPVTNSVGEILLAFLSLAILPALGEEFLVRGSVFTSLKNSIGIKKAVLFSALFFALMHGSVSQLGHQFLVGLACAIFVALGGSVWYGVILHLTNNALTVGLNVINSSSALQIIPTPQQFFTSWSFPICFALCVLGLIGVYFLIGYALKRKLGDKAPRSYKILSALSLLEEKPTFEWTDKGQNRIFYASVIALGLLVVVDLVVVLCGGTI